MGISLPSTSFLRSRSSSKTPAYEPSTESPSKKPSSARSRSASTSSSPGSAATPVFQALSAEEIEYMASIGVAPQRDTSEEFSKISASSEGQSLSKRSSVGEDQSFKSSDGISVKKEHKRLSSIDPPSKESLKKFKKHFPELGNLGETGETNSEHDTSLIKVYSCAYDKEGGITHTGKLYLTKTVLAFHGTSFARTLNIEIKIEDLSDVSKKSTLGVFPNAIRLTTHKGKDYVLSTFSKRDATYDHIVAVWNIYLASEDKQLKRASISNFLEPADKGEDAKRTRSRSSVSKFLKNTLASTSSGDILLRKLSGVYLNLI
jgi:hypothetical protein